MIVMLGVGWMQLLLDAQISVPDSAYRELLEETRAAQEVYPETEYFSRVAQALDQMLADDS